MSDNSQVNNLEQLGNKLWITRKCRINAEKRLLSNAQFLNFSNIYYSIIITIVSILSIIIKSNAYSAISVIMSVALTISVTFASSLNYKERAEIMKRNYLDINQLETKLKYVDQNNTSEIEKIEQEYNRLLDNVENHLEYDYYKYLSAHDEASFNLKMKALYYTHIIFTWSFKIFLIILPIISTIIITRVFK